VAERPEPSIPKTAFVGRALDFDFPSFEIGVAEYDEGPTGCTVFHFPPGADTAIDKRGGLVGSVGDYEWNHAICLAGGSLPGLEAAAGVGTELWDRHARSLERMPLVSGAIIFDYGGRESRVYPDHSLGRAALRAARPGHFPLGARGAGRSAGCGGILDFARGEPSGQGGAFRQFGPTKVAAFVVVNALGVVLDRAGRVARGNRDPRSGSREHPLVEVTRRVEAGERSDVVGGSTTLTVVVTNQKVDRRGLTQLARQVHSSMARVIYPFHTLLDGDVLFAVTTNEVNQPTLGVAALGMLASELVWDAILAIWDTSSGEATGGAR
jgi:L-aminopeptidase/D-esterase-like protein